MVFLVFCASHLLHDASVCARVFLSLHSQATSYAGRKVRLCHCFPLPTSSFDLLNIECTTNSHIVVISRSEKSRFGFPLCDKAFMPGSRLFFTSLSLY